ncbi:MAG: hypothetical protein V5A47_09455 [Bacteroidales bacterium]
MPKPRPDESKKKYIQRCTKELIVRENRSPEQARLLCEKYWNQYKNNSRSELRFPLMILR